MKNLGQNVDKNTQPDDTQNQPQPEGDINEQDDLLSQIAAEDLVQENQEKKRISFSAVFLVSMMRLTLFFDEISHKNAPLFRILSTIWSIFIGSVYLGGLSALIILVYTYLQFPHFIENYFRQNNIQLATWKIRDYNFSKIELEDLQDTEKTYRIDRMIIRSNFSDFLRKKVKAVVLNGVNIKIHEKNNQIDIGNLIQLLVSLNQNKSAFIESVSVMGASLEFKGENYTFPIQFSMTGFYENNANISIPLIIKEKNINATGVLSITSAGSLLNWNLHNLSGTITSENQQPENISGEFTFKTEKMRLISISGSGELSYGSNSKKVKIDLKNTKGLFQGTVDLSIVASDISNKSTEAKSNILFLFKGLDLKTFNQIESSSPIAINIRSLNTQHFSLSNTSTTLKGFLNCTDMNCSYQLNGNSPVTIQALKIFKGGDVIYSNQPITFVLHPNGQNNFIWQNHKITANLNIGNLKYKGYRNTNNFPLSINIAKTTVNGYSLFGKENVQLGISTNGLTYETDTRELKNASVFIENLWDSASKFTLNTKYFYLKNNTLLKQPFALNLQKENDQTRANIFLLDNLIRIDFWGNADFNLNEFKGKIFIPPFELSKIPNNLRTISDLFPGTVSSASGQIAAFGNINWKSEKQISGPLYISLKNIDFNAPGVTVSKLNSVLSLQTLVPFVSQAGQLISIEKVEGPLPLQNILATVKFDPQMLRIFSFDSEIGGLVLSTNNVVIPYKASNTTIPLKNNLVNWAYINNYLNFPGLILEGSGSIYLPIEIKDNTFTLGNGEIKFNNLRMKYSNNNKDLHSKLFKGNTEYIIRTGSILLNTDSNNNVKSYINLDGRLNPSKKKYIFKKNNILNLRTLFKPMERKSVPESITSKQKIIVQ